MGTEWNIGEQDDLFASAFCDSWKTDASVVEEDTTATYITLGNTVKSFLMLKHYPQTPVAYQLYEKEYVNQLTMDFATDSFVKLTWNFMGSNNPLKNTSGNVPTYNDGTNTRSLTLGTASTTKSFITKQGWLKYGDDVDALTPVRQSPSMNITINNNLERTPALFEEDSIENSLGDFVISGSFDVYNVDALGHTIYNDAVAGADKILQVAVQRKVGDITTSYVLTLNVHLGAPSESKNGNKLQFSVPFQVNGNTNLKLQKIVLDESE